MSSKTALPVALLVVVFLMAWPTVKLLAQNTCPGCSEPAKVVHPNGFGPQSYARWQPKTGLADSAGTTGDFSMLLVHLTPATITATARAVVAIEGFDSRLVGPASGQVTNLAFWVRTTDPMGMPTGECTLTSPRFSIRWRLSPMPDQFSEARCANVAEMGLFGTTATAVNGFTYEKRTVSWVFTGQAFATIPPGAIIISLAILYDDLLQLSSHIDDIEVTDTTNGCPPCIWTRPADNGSN